MDRDAPPIDAYDEQDAPPSQPAPDVVEVEDFGGPDVDMGGSPSNVDAERRAIGCVLRKPELLGETRLTSDEFYLEGHRVIWQAIRDTAAGGHVDLVTVGERLRSLRKLDAVGGGAALAHLLADVGTTIGFGRVCAIIETKARIRRIITAATTIAQQGYDPGVGADDYASRSEALIMSAARGRHDTGGLVDVVDILEDVLVSSGEAMERGAAPAEATGWGALNRRLNGGLYPRELIVVGARPGMGKSAFGVQAAEDVAFRCEKEGRGCVAVFSIESSAQSLGRRILRGHTGRGEDYGVLEPKAYQAWVDAAANVPRGRLFVDERAGVTIEDIASECRRAHTKEPVRLVVIDYLQFMRASDNRIPREQQVSHISRSSKELSKELACPVLLLSQLNRGVEQRTDKRPMLSDLRESGAIEQDANVVMFLYRDRYYSPDSEADWAEVIVAKQRDGGNGTTRLTWDGPTTRFGDYIDGVGDWKGRTTNDGRTWG